MTVTVDTKHQTAVVSIDNPPVNALSQAVRQGLLDAVKQCEEARDVTSVVLCCAGRTFVAGADIREFNKPPMEPHLPDVLMAIEQSSKPWVAAIHGTALGGGLELAMACRARIADQKAKVGLPEVNLGLLPGAGGTVRLPRLVPAEEAIKIIAGGKPVSAAKACSAGLIDELVESDLKENAIRFAASLSADYVPTLARPVNQPDLPEEFEKTKQQLMAKARGQESVGSAIAALEVSLRETPEAAFANERKTFLALKASPQSAALRHIFFAERATLSDPRCKVSARPFDKVGIIGGGTMGAGIAAACLLSGLEVTMVERDTDAALAGQKRVDSILSQSKARGLISDDKEKLIKSRFETADRFEALADRQLVIEAVFEDMDVKKTVFKELQQVVPEDTVLATNTSYLDVNELAQSVDVSSRVIGLHFFSPAHVMKLLEIVVPDRVSDDVVATAASFSKRLGKVAVLSGVCDGFIANRIMSAYRKEADYLVEDGAWPEEVDGAMRDFGYGMGIFEMQDLAGLDIGWANRKRLAPTRDPKERYVEIADKLCELGRFGRKTGKGWYIHQDGKSSADPDVRALIEAERARKGINPASFTTVQIMDRILGAMQEEAQKVLAEGIATKPSDIDVAIINGYGFPRWRGGPMFMLQEEQPD